MYRYDESSRVLSLVATHSRDHLVATALALSPRPLVASFDDRGKEHSQTCAPLVALADRTTRTVAVLSLPRFNSRSSATRPPFSVVGDSNGNGVRGGHDDSGEEEAGDAVKQLHLMSVWPCREKVTSLVAAASGQQESAVDSDDDGCEDNNRDEDEQRRRHQRHRHRHQRVVDEASRFAGGSGRDRPDMFLMGTGSGTVWTAGVEPPPPPAMVSRALLKHHERTSHVDPER